MTAADVEAELTRIGHTLAPLDIVVVNTARRRALRPAGLRRHRLRHGPRGDALSHGARRARHRHRRLELGCAVRPHRASATPRRATPSLIWEGHKAGREIGYCHIEKLHNLEALPRDGFHGELLSGEDPRRLGRLDARGRDLDLTLDVRRAGRINGATDKIATHDGAQPAPGRTSWTDAVSSPARPLPPLRSPIRPTFAAGRLSVAPDHRRSIRFRPAAPPTW